MFDINDPALKLRRDIRIPAELMKVARIQPEPERRRNTMDDFPVPLSAGTTAYAENLREFCGQLRPTGRSRLLLTTPYEPSFCETRGDDTNFFTLDKTNTLRQVLTLRKVDGTTDIIRLNKTVATLPSPIRDTALCSSFSVLLLENGEIHYLDYDQETALYRYLGPLPEMPDFEAVAVEQPRRTVEIEEYTFPSRISDFRKGVDDKVASALGARMKKALETAQSNALAEGLFTSAVAVRVALRLWDGRLAAVSAPKLVGDATNGAGDYSVSFPLAGDSDGFTGTGPATLSVNAYRLDIRGIANGAASLVPEQWARLVRRLEVWVTPQGNDFRTGAPCSFSFRQADPSASPVLHGAFALADTSRRPGRLLKAAMCHLGDMSPVAGEAVAVRRDESAATSDPSAGVSPLASFRAGAVASHDGFLHLGNISRLLPVPVIPATDSQELPLRCRVAVTVNTRRGPREIVNYGYLPGGTASGLLYYPDSRATKMTVGVWDADSSYYERSFELASSGSEAGGAWYVSSHARPVEIIRDRPAAPPSDSDNPISGPLEEHLPEMVITCHRGNPLAIADSFYSAGDSVVALAPQTVGGGAFTRQYVYVFTRSGISAINHDMNGRYTNLRSVSATRVSSVHQFVPTPKGLAVLSQGELLLISDHKVSHLLRGLSEYDRLLWDSRQHELWLVPPKEGARGARSLALDLDSFDDVGARGSMRSPLPYKILCNRGETFFASPFALSWSIYITESYESGLDTSRWISTPLPVAFRGFGLLSCRMGGWHEGEIDVSLLTRYPFGRSCPADERADREFSADDDILIVRGRSGKATGGPYRIPFLFPFHKNFGADRNRFYIRIEGAVRYLTDVTLYERTSPAPFVSRRVRI